MGAEDSVTDRPVALDLCVGLGGWVNGLTAEGWRVIGIDIEDMFAALNEPKPDHFDLVIEDICNVRGADYAHVDLIVGSSPCQDFSYRAMPWSRAKALHAPFLGMWLFWQQFRIQREICAAKGEYVPMIVENVRGAQPWVGRARGNFGSYFLWGDVPALMPKAIGGGGRARQKTHDGEQWNVNRKNFTGTLGWEDCERGDDVRKSNPDGSNHGVGSWFKIADSKNRGASEGLKNPGFRFDGSGKSFQTESVERHADGRKHHGDWFRDPDCPTRQGGQNKVAEGVKMGGGGWFNDGDNPNRTALMSSKSPARKAASAKIAKIPLAISQFIGQVYLPGGQYTPAK